MVHLSSPLKQLLDLPDGAVSCKRDGFCDGGGACRVYLLGAACNPSVCEDNILSTFKCDGSGQCDQSSLDCGDYLCAGGACTASCATEVDCDIGAFCDAGQCKPKFPAGKSPCSSGDQCATGLCVEGFCCNAPCTGVCETCGI